MGELDDCHRHLCPVSSPERYRPDSLGQLMPGEEQIDVVRRWITD